MKTSLLNLVLKNNKKLIFKTNASIYSQLDSYNNMYYHDFYISRNFLWSNNRNRFHKKQWYCVIIIIDNYKNNTLVMSAHCYELPTTEIPSIKSTSGWWKILKYFLLSVIRITKANSKSYASNCPSITK